MAESKKNGTLKIALAIITVLCSALIVFGSGELLSMKSTDKDLEKKITKVEDTARTERENLKQEISKLNAGQSEIKGMLFMTLRSLGYSEKEIKREIGNHLDTLTIEK